MARLFMILSLGLVLAASAGARASTTAEQALGIDLTATQPQVDRLDRYTLGRPIDVRVTAPEPRGVELVGVSPDGATVRVPLVRGRDGTFGGAFTPGTPGTWSLAVATDTTGSATTSPFPVVVAEPGASDAAAAAMFALAIASIGGGIGLITVGRKNATGGIATA